MRYLSVSLDTVVAHVQIRLGFRCCHITFHLADNNQKYWISSGSSFFHCKNLGLIFSDSKLNKIIFPSDQFSMNSRVAMIIMVSCLFEADLQQQEMREIAS